MFPLKICHHWFGWWLVAHMATSHYLSLWTISDDELNRPPRIYLIKYKEKYCHTTLQNFQELYTSLYIFSLPALLHTVQEFFFLLYWELVYLCIDELVWKGVNPLLMHWSYNFFLFLAYWCIHCTPMLPMCGSSNLTITKNIELYICQISNHSL